MEIGQIFSYDIIGDGNKKEFKILNFNAHEIQCIDKNQQQILFRNNRQMQLIIDNSKFDKDEISIRRYTKEELIKKLNLTLYTNDRRYMFLKMLDNTGNLISSINLDNNTDTFSYNLIDECEKRNMFDKIQQGIDELFPEINV